MFNRTKINTGLVGLVGYAKPSNPDFNVVNETNQASRSGRYFTDNAYCKIEYIKDCQDYKNATRTQINELLTGIQKNAIINVVDQVFDNDDLLERDLLFPYAQNKQDNEILPNGFIGYRIRKKANIAFEVKRIFFEFTNTGTITVYLFSSNQKDALYAQEFTISTTGFQSLSPTSSWIVDNTTNYDGEYYLGYVKGNLISYKRNYENADLMAYFDNLCIERINVPDHTGSELFDLQDIEGLGENTGINPDVIVFEDYTDIILRSENLISGAIQKAGQIEIIKMIMASFRSNYNQRVTNEIRNNMLFSIEGNPELKIYGLKNELEREVKKLRDAFKQKKEIKLITRE